MYEASRFSKTEYIPIFSYSDSKKLMYHGGLFGNDPRYGGLDNVVEFNQNLKHAEKTIGTR